MWLTEWDLLYFLLDHLSSRRWLASFLPALRPEGFLFYQIKNENKEHAPHKGIEQEFTHPFPIFDSYTDGRIMCLQGSARGAAFDGPPVLGIRGIFVVQSTA